jgi:glycosyltransferase involved in cell wall biosynthesis
VRVACFIGAIKPEKNYPLALETADRLTRMSPDWRVLFIGDQLSAPGPYRPGAASHTADYKGAVLEYYGRLNRRDRIKLCGRRKDTAAILKQSDVLFITSLHEGFPNVVLEAMGLGVPVISTEYSDIRRILPFPEQIVIRHSADDMAQAVTWAHSRRAVIASRQKAWVQSHATLQQAAAALEDVYRRYVKDDVCADDGSSYQREVSR